MAESGINTEQAFDSVIKIADEVIVSIAALAATDIEGVAGISGCKGSKVMNIFAAKALNKGVRAVIDESDVKLTLSLVIDYGYNIPVVSRQVQEKVAATVSNMTGFTVSEVNINIADIKLPES